MKSTIIMGCCAVVAVAVSACATLTPEQQAALRRDGLREVTCDGAADCDLKWSRAVQWVLDNNHHRIEVMSDVMIQTAAPRDSSTHLSVVITRTPLGDGRYRLDMRGSCDNMFGCTPSYEVARAHFVRAVMDGQSGRQ